MTKAELLERFSIASPVNYDIDFITEQLNTLENAHGSRLCSAREEMMFVNIICSAVKYYLDASPEGYGSDIINITDRLEIIYDIDGLFEALLDLSE